MRTMFLKKESAWKFVTSSTGGVGAEFVAAEGGKLYFQDPQGKDVTFVYGAAGVGYSVGLKLPKIGKLEVKVKGKSVFGAIAPAAFPNAGKLYIADTFSGNELSQNDIRGVCVFLEVAGGLVAGVSATAMLVGISPVWLAGLSLAPVGGPLAMAYLDYKMIEAATGLLVMAGVNVGLTAGGGIGAFIGGLY